MSIHKLQEMLAEAREEAASDSEYWANEARGQESDEAEESGRLIGYAEGLEAALKVYDA